MLYVKPAAQWKNSISFLEPKKLSCCHVPARCTGSLHCFHSSFCAVQQLFVTACHFKMSIRYHCGYFSPIRNFSRHFQTDVPRADMIAALPLYCCFAAMRNCLDDSHWLCPWQMAWLIWQRADWKTPLIKCPVLLKEKGQSAATGAMQDKCMMERF